MNESPINRATHFSIVWAVVLAILTLVEWRSLERAPTKEEIFLPFIERKISLSLKEAGTAEEFGLSTGEQSGVNAESGLQTEMEIDFNGPLFLACFFGPVLVFHGIGLLSARLGRGT